MKLNPPHASSFGGVWERQIGTICRVLDTMFAKLSSRQLAHELLVTPMAEVTSIVIARQIAALLSDVNDPQPHSPAMLLTMKTLEPEPIPGNFVPRTSTQTDVESECSTSPISFGCDGVTNSYKINPPIRTKSKPQRDLAQGDVLIKEEGEYRNDWLMGRVVEGIKSTDRKVRKAFVAAVKEGRERKRSSALLKSWFYCFQWSHSNHEMSSEPAITYLRQLMSKRGKDGRSLDEECHVYGDEL